MNPTQQNNIAMTALSYFKSGNPVIDMIIVTVGMAAIMAVTSRFSELSALIQRYLFYFLHPGNRLKYKIVIKLNTLDVSSNGRVTSMADNTFNKYLINGIIQHITKNQILEKTRERELVNVVTYKGHASTREAYLNNELRQFPTSRVHYRDMILEFLKSDSSSTKEANVTVTSNMVIIIYGNSESNIQEFIKECNAAEVDKSHPLDTNSNARYYYSMLPKKNDDSTVAYVRYPYIVAKNFSSLFFDDKERILQVVQNFMDHKGAWDPSRDRSYVLRMILHGRPGSGKSSFLKALSNMTGRNQVNVSIPVIRNNEELLDVFASSVIYFTDTYNMDQPRHMQHLKLDKKLYIMEDMDCAGCKHVITREEAVEEKSVDTILNLITVTDVNKQESKKEASLSKSKVNLSGFLNMLDGPYELTGAMIAITTNDITKFDAAIIRPGRMDLNIFLGAMSNANIKLYLEYYYKVKDITLPVFTIKDMNPSKLEQICQMNLTMEDTIEELSNM